MAAIQKRQSPVGAGLSVEQSQSYYAAKHSKSTATGAQQARVLALLREAPRSTAELRKFGIFCPAPRVMELRAQGHVILTAREPYTDDNGYWHRNAGRYVLLREAEE
ncbi:MAG: helix-turn-helix domain-containing protein [Thermomonas sp.]|uniref:helix-turn-helix domain-containing protein n=1 Tax=Thermomonas sp. TaxID=1971895 RepID=UPI001ED7380C|nr:helix-turn-helix domain-containing protein [Thermomonas sp.]MBV2208202.1 helix-turn-helix domain-containing protein [Thermomonas sp.]